MRYHAFYDDNGYLKSVGTGLGGIEISEERYNKFRALILNTPAAPDNTHVYKITEAGEYVLVESPHIEVPYEPTTEDKAEAWDILAGDAE